MRGFRKQKYEELGLRCTGMEFANEMIIKSSLFKQRIAEIPITLYVDGRTIQAPHLRTFRDGWRTLRFLLMCTPRWLFLLPAVILIFLGIVGYALVLCTDSIFGGHTLLFSSLALLLGHQAGIFAVISRWITVDAKILRPDWKLKWFLRTFSLERGILIALATMCVGSILMGVPVWRWWSSGFAELSYERNLLWVVPGVTLVAIGVQTLLASFLLNLLEFSRQ